MEVDSILPDLIEVSVDIFDPFQPHAIPGDAKPENIAAMIEVLENQ
ncbi:MAG: hypothetical protein JRG97_04850 [Deltaproteobacteria bacterium]|nr:hypothetical protein [Deltaproteobacteria bacterium]MBW2051760.1 hypothetical protein [Deltaproteobacteria bacterium]MBW2140384.1 hypothetical protein [Deltaproteobacteria bacterium]MBW2322370.1 hypothetical protein [Deltaproteobacteria bacterium]